MCVLTKEVSPSFSGGTVDAGSLCDAARAAYKLLMAAHPELAGTPDAECWIERAAAVLARNVASGRYTCAQRYGQHNSPSLSTYAQQVLTRLLTEWERVEALQAGDTGHWMAILKRMERVAYFWFGPVGREEWAVGEAREMAAKTCADLWQWLQRNPFPFDVAFDHWAERALRNRLKESARFRRRQDRYVVDSLDRPCFEESRPRAGLLPTDDMSIWLELESKREALRQAYVRLDQRQAHIVHLWYVEGWSAEEIAAETRLEVGHVYVLKHRALKKLRQYCTDA